MELELEETLMQETNVKPTRCPGPNADAECDFVALIRSVNADMAACPIPESETNEEQSNARAKWLRATRAIRDPANFREHFVAFYGHEPELDHA